MTEVWTSPDLKIIVSSKRSDPRMGEQTFKLTNITRADPDPSLFTVPADFKVIEGPQRCVWGDNRPGNAAERAARSTDFSLWQFVRATTKTRD